MLLNKNWKKVTTELIAVKKIRNTLNFNIIFLNLPKGQVPTDEKGTYYRPGEEIDTSSLDVDYDYFIRCYTNDNKEHEVQTIYLGGPNGTQVCQSYVEYNVKKGTQWELSHRFVGVAATNGIVAFKITTGSKPVILKGSEISTEAQAFVRRIFKGSTATVDAAISIYNLNDELNPLTPLTTVNVVTGLTGGTECFAPFYRKNSSGGTSGTSTVRTGGGLVAGLDKILKPNTTYYFSFQNLGTEVAEITFYSTFYEGDYYA